MPASIAALGNIPAAPRSDRRLGRSVIFRHPGQRLVTASASTPTGSRPRRSTVVETCRSIGSGGFCPTLVTADGRSSGPRLRHTGPVCDDDPASGPSMPAFHLEGPYIAAEDGPRGAHRESHVRAPDWDEFRRLAGRGRRPDSPGHAGPGAAGGTAIHRKAGGSRRRRFDRPHGRDAGANPTPSSPARG